jgi:hypothetical protein
MLRALHCRVPPRQAGNFHLRGQMKVTKAKALNATPFTRSARYADPVQGATFRHRDASSPQRAGRRGPRKASPALTRWTQGQSEARPRRVSCRFGLRRWFQVARRAGWARSEERAERFCLQPLCFGDFHLGPQMKVTRLPGRDPARQRGPWISASRVRRMAPSAAPPRTPSALPAAPACTRGKARCAAACAPAGSHRGSSGRA